MTENQKKTSAHDSWASLLTELGLEEPAPTPEASSPEPVATAVPEQAAQEEHPFEMPPVGNERPETQSKPASAEPTEKPERSSFFSMFPKFDLFSSSTKEKVDIAVAGLTESVIPAVREVQDAVQQTLDAVAPKRLEKVDEEALRRRKEKRKPGRKNDPWSVLASQLGVLAQGGNDEDVDDHDDDETEAGAAAAADEKPVAMEKAVVRETTAASREEEPRERDRGRRRGDRRRRDSRDDRKAAEPTAEETESRPRGHGRDRVQSPRETFAEELLPPIPTKAFESRPARETTAVNDDLPEREPEEHRGRRRRGRRRDEQETEGFGDRRPTVQERDDDGDDSFENRSRTPNVRDREDETRPGRRRRGSRTEEAAESMPRSNDLEDSTWDMEDEARPVERGRRGRSRSGRPPRGVSAPVESSDDDHYEDTELVQLHQSIPSWGEAVATVVEVNISRRNQRSSGGGRGRR